MSKFYVAYFNEQHQRWYSCVDRVEGNAVAKAGPFDPPNALRVMLSLKSRHPDVTYMLREDLPVFGPDALELSGWPA